MKSLLVYREAMVVPAAIGKISHPPNMVSKPTPSAVRIKRSRLVKQNPVATGCITTVILVMGATITRRITMLAREDYLFLLVRVDLSTSQAYPFSDLTGCIILINKFMEEKNGKRKMQKLSDEELLNVTGGGEKGSDTDRCSGLSHQKCIQTFGCKWVVKSFLFFSRKRCLETEAQTGTYINASAIP